jgi:hypothetical protein
MWQGNLAIIDLFHVYIIICSHSIPEKAVTISPMADRSSMALDEYVDQYVTIHVLIGL